MSWKEPTSEERPRAYAEMTATEADATPTTTIIGRRMLIVLIPLLLAASSAWAQDPNEPNDSLSEATPLACPAAIDVEIDPLRDVDFYELSVSPGDIVTIDIDADEFGSTLDSVLGIFDAFGTLRDTSDDSTGPGETDSLDSFLLTTGSGGGALFIAVSAFSDFGFDGTDAGSTGFYSLIVACESPVPDGSEPNNSLADATPVSLPLHPSQTWTSSRYRSRWGTSSRSTWMRPSSGRPSIPCSGSWIPTARFSRTATMIRPRESP
jgi:hypothetical protein